MLTYADIATRLGVPRGTLGRRIAAHNRSHPSDRIDPDRKDDHGHFQRFLFSDETVKKIITILSQQRTKRGRPKNASN